ncbi:MAG: DUF5060 domain-containing protein [Mariniblastus sp.]
MDTMVFQRHLQFLSAMFATVSLVFCGAERSIAAEQWRWETVETVGLPTARHEAAFVAFKDKIYLIGGRRINPVDVFDPATNTWTEKSKTPLELHHFQAVVVGDAIYLIGAMTGPYPNEKPLEKIAVYYPETDKFDFVHTIPESRRRGGAGAVVRDGKIYVVGGITNGHVDGSQNWFDEYDPKTGDWKPLPNAPHVRDHFQAVVCGDKLYAVAGRRTSKKTEQTFELTIPRADVFDFKTEKWNSLSDCPVLPTHRAGNMAMNWNDEVIIGGGESGDQIKAHDEVEAFNFLTRQWRRWPSLAQGRHGSGFAIVGGYVYAASGCGNRGGSPELTTIERLKLPRRGEVAPTAVAVQAIETPAKVKLHHCQTISFIGPETSESATPNPFTDYRLQVTFTHLESKRSKIVRGFYAADGNAAESGAESGGVWQVRFAPDEAGTWKYTAELRVGDHIAIDLTPTSGKQVEIENPSGTFEVWIAENDPTDKNAVAGNDTDQLDFRTRGRLVADDGYFRFEGTKRRMIKVGADSPENLLAFVDFDGTFRTSDKARDGENDPGSSLHRFPTHVADWSDGDPSWRDGKGKGLIGAINYLSSTGMNCVYFLTMNINGDGKDVWPYAKPDDFTRFDCSKLDQWEIVFDHMQRKGILIHLVTQETENENLLDGGDTGPLRKLYYSELIARFAHHPALVWNLGEENGPVEWSPVGQNSEQQKAMASYFKSVDPYNHPVLIHTHSTITDRDKILPPLVAHQPLDGLSFQVDKPSQVHDEVIRWKALAKKSGHPWMITMDEIGKWDTGVVPDSVDADHDGLRHQVLWGSLLAGGAGVEWYFGAKQPHNDLTSEDWRQRANMWAQTKIALDFFEQHLPYWKMQPADELTAQKNDYCFANPGYFYAIYLPMIDAKEREATRLSFQPGSVVHAKYDVRWYSPKRGGELQSGSVESFDGTESGEKDLGAPPKNQSEDWVILVRPAK